MCKLSSGSTPVGKLFGYLQSLAEVPGRSVRNAFRSGFFALRSDCEAEKKDNDNVSV
jgi:hypothetical protein